MLAARASRSFHPSSSLAAAILRRNALVTATLSSHGVGAQGTIRLVSSGNVDKNGGENGGRRGKEDRRKGLPRPKFDHSSRRSQHQEDKIASVASGNNRNRHKRQSSLETMKSSSRQVETSSSLQACMDAMSTLLQRHKSLERNGSLPTQSWLPPSDPEGELFEATTQEFGDPSVLLKRHELFRDSIRFTRSVAKLLRDERIRVSGKDTRKVNALLANVLTIYASSPPSWILRSLDVAEYSPTPHEAAAAVLGVMSNHNMDVGPADYASTIRASCQEGQWASAARTFSSQIDHDAGGGFAPVDATLGWDRPLEMGLYAIARAAQEGLSQPDISRPHSDTDPAVDTDAEVDLDAIVRQATSPAGERVFDAAVSMGMTSPTNEENYILAAGSALGRIGEWKSSIKFLLTSEHKDRLGQTLLAAVMNACVLCHRYDVALFLYQEMADASGMENIEWQWAGGREGPHRLCRDLAMRSMGRITQLGKSTEALGLFDEVIGKDESVTVAAIHGLLEACEGDGNLRGSFQVLSALLDSTHRTGWTIVGDHGKETINEAKKRLQSTDTRIHHLNEEMLACIMRTCNNVGEFGLAQLCSMLVGLRQRPGKDQSLLESLEGATENRGAPFIQTVLSAHPSLTKNERVLIETMTSLRGLQCPNAALELHDKVVEERSGDGSHQETWHDAEEERDVAQLTAERRDHETLAENSWKRTHELLYRIIGALVWSASTDDVITEEGERALTIGMAKLLRCCADLEQPNLGLQVAKMCAHNLPSSVQSASMTETVSSLLGLPTPIKEVTIGGELNDLDDVEVDFLASSDCLISAAMRVLAMLDKSDVAIHIFSRLLSRQDGNLKGWPSSVSEAIQIYVDAKQMEDANALFAALEEYERLPSTFLSLAQGLYEAEDWEAILSLYSIAASSQCLSDDLAVMALQAANESTDSSMRTIRDIIDEAAETVGIRPEKWAEARYWTLKSRLGWHTARLIMRWNDPVNSWKNEQKFALSQLKEYRRNRLVVKHEVVKCIVNLAGYNQRFRNKKHRGEPVEDIVDDEEARRNQELERIRGLQEVKDALEEARKSDLIENANFIADVAMAMRALKGNAECIDLIFEAMSAGFKVNFKAIDQALRAADVEGDEETYAELLQIKEKLGY